MADTLGDRILWAAQQWEAIRAEDGVLAGRKEYDDLRALALRATAAEALADSLAMAEPARGTAAAPSPRRPVDGWDPRDEWSRIQRLVLAAGVAVHVNEFSDDQACWEIQAETDYDFPNSGDEIRDLESATLAAEDAARTMVADMAAALGGVVVWPEADGGGGPMQAGGQK